MPTLNWVGKDKVVNHHHDVPFRVLEKRGMFTAPEGTPSNTTDNRIIRGDNLEALKSLLPEFEGRVHCVYIDPPYNTGNEGWIYNDNVNDPKIKRWLGQVVGKEGEDFSRHDKWLCMMYPRLKLLHRLLAPEGLIFVSIANDEQHGLRLLLDEVFGRLSFVQTFIWVTHGHTENQDDVNETHEYIHCFARSVNGRPEANFLVDHNIPADSKIRRDFAENSITKNGPKNPHSAVALPVGFPCEIQALDLAPSAQAAALLADADEKGFISPGMTQSFGGVYPMRLDPMKVTEGRLEQPCRVFCGWANLSKLKVFIDNDCKPIADGDTQLHFFLSKNGVIYYRREGRAQRYISSVLENYGTVELARNELAKMGLHFPYPKPVSLIAWLISLFTPRDAIVLDSFAGSGTTAHAVLSLNAQDLGTRRFILIEMMEYADNVTAERVRRVTAGYGQGQQGVAGLGGGFEFYDVGAPLFLDDDNINEAVGLDAIRSYVAHSEGIPIADQVTQQNPWSAYLLGMNADTAWLFYYEPDQATCLDLDFLASLRLAVPGGKRPATAIIYADKCVLTKAFLTQQGIVFKKIPRDISRF